MKIEIHELNEIVFDHHGANLRALKSFATEKHAHCAVVAHC